MEDRAAGPQSSVPAGNDSALFHEHVLWRSSGVLLPPVLSKRLLQVARAQSVDCTQDAARGPDRAGLGGWDSSLWFAARQPDTAGTSVRPNSDDFSIL